MRVCANVVEAILSSQFDAKKLKKSRPGVKCILTCPLWLQIYVSIVNRSIGTYYSQYSITYDVLLIFPRLFDKFKCQILRKLCEDGVLCDLIKIHDPLD